LKVIANDCFWPVPDYWPTGGNRPNGVKEKAGIGGRSRFAGHLRHALSCRIDLGLDGVTRTDWLANIGEKMPRAAART
jgi:hypothetical protein